MVAESAAAAGRASEAAAPPAPAPAKHQPCRVVLMDGTALELMVDKRCKGKALFHEVTSRLDLMEKDYFGLSFREEDDTHVWLQLDKRVSKQLGHNAAWVFFFEVKFYPPEPNELTEDITRYYLTLHLRNDIATGKLPCSFVSYAILGAYLVQAQLGDYDPGDHGHGTDYLREFPLMPDPQDPLLLEKVAELHRAHIGMSPADAEREYLDKVKCIALYGVEKHPAKDSEGTDIWLGVCASGILVFHDKLRINRFPWPKIQKVSFRRNIFYVKLCPGEFEQTESTVGFRLATVKQAKRLWKSAVEHHAFFRLMSTDVPAEKKPVIPRLGSTNFRFSGRTQFQSRLASSMIDRQPPLFTRSMSTRLPTSSSYSIVDNGVSAVPLSQSAAPIMHKSVDEKPYHEGEDVGWTVTTSSMEQREQEGEPETETVQETLPDGTVVTRTITKRRVVKQVISKQVIETHGEEGAFRVLSASSPVQTSPEHHVHETQTRSILLSSTGPGSGDTVVHTAGEFVGSQSVTSDGRTVETVTYKTEKDGKTETHTEKRVVIHGEGIDHDAELTAAILEATQMDPNVMVEKIEVRQQRQT